MTEQSMAEDRAWARDWLDEPEPDDEDEGSLATGCWCPEGHCTCDAQAMHDAEFREEDVS